MHQPKLEECGLDELRQLIDTVDEQIVACLAKRIQLVTKIGERKQTLNCSVVQRNRAAKVEQNYVQLGVPEGLDSEFLRQLYQLVHAESCRVQARIILKN